MARHSGAPAPSFRDIAEQIRESVAGVKVIVLIGPDGDVTDHLVLDSRFDLETFASEYTTLLRIARRTSEDAGAGALREHVVVSAASFTIARSFGDDACLVLVSDMEDQLGRARYELKRAARLFERVV
jgi:predicted regulator of Ras-like GTPase activity (Roadblock/LC7/MglB family)